MKDHCITKKKYKIITFTIFVFFLCGMSCAPIGYTCKTYTDKLTYTAVIVVAYYAGISSIPSI